MTYWIRLSPKQAVNHGIPSTIAQDQGNYFYGVKGYATLPDRFYIDSQYPFLAFVHIPKFPNLTRFHCYTIDELWDGYNPLENTEYGGVPLRKNSALELIGLLTELSASRSLSSNPYESRFIPLTENSDLQAFHIRHYDIPNSTVSYFHYAISPQSKPYDDITLIRLSNTEIQHLPPEMRWGLGFSLSHFSPKQLEDPRFTPFDHGGLSCIDLTPKSMLELAVLIQEQINAKGM